VTTSRTRTTPPAQQDQDGKDPPDVTDDERPERTYQRGGIVRYTYLDGADQPHERYGLVVDLDGPLVAWLPVEHAGHL